MREKDRVYSEAEIVERLEKELPKWRYENGWIRRKYKTHSWKSTLMVINTVGHLAEAAWHHPDLKASYARHPGLPSPRWLPQSASSNSRQPLPDCSFPPATPPGPAPPPSPAGRP